MAGVLFMNGAPIVVEQWAQRLAVHKGLRVHLTGGKADMVLPHFASEWVRQYAPRPRKRRPSCAIAWVCGAMAWADGQQCIACMQPLTQQSVPSVTSVTPHALPACAPRRLLETNGAKLTHHYHTGGHELGGPDALKSIASYVAGLIQ